VPILSEEVVKGIKTTFLVYSNGSFYLLSTEICRIQRIGNRHCNLNSALSEKEILESMGSLTAVAVGACGKLATTWGDIKR